MASYDRTARDRFLLRSKAAAAAAAAGGFLSLTVAMLGTAPATATPATTVTPATTTYTAPTYDTVTRGS